MTLNASRVRRDAAYNAEAQRLMIRHRADISAFDKTLQSECFLSDALARPEDLLTFRLNPDRVRTTIKLQFNALTAMHQIWRDHLDGKAQTPQEHALGRYLAAIVNEAVETAAVDAAEAECES